MSSSARPLFRLKDVVVILLLLVAFPIAALVPRTWLIKLSGKLVNLFKISHGGKTDAKLIKSALEIEQETADDIATKSLQCRLASTLLFLRSVIYGPQIPVVLRDKHILDNALANGQGAVLWVAELTFGPDACKVALSDNNYNVSHLSRPEHGFSSSSFGVKFLNPIRTAYELRFLEQRIVFTPERRELVAKQISDTIAKNEFVSFLASGHVGRSLITTSFLNGSLSMAAGGAAAAYNNNAPLIPVFCTPTSGTDALHVTIGEPIALVGNSKREIIHNATVEYIHRLELIVKAYPELFLQWSFVSPRDENNE